MPVALNLNQDQWLVLEQAVKGKNIVNLATGVRTIQLSRENVIPIRDAIKSFHSKKFAIKTKTVVHLETCLYCEQIVSRINDIVRVHFSDLEVANDPEMGVVETKTKEAPKPSTKTESEAGDANDE